MDSYALARQRERKQVLTKTVHPDWYRRYAKVLNYDDRIFLQPLREIREEKKMLKDLETIPTDSDKAIQMSQKLTEARNMRIRLVLQLLEGNVRNVDLSCLKPSNETPLSALTENQEKVQTLFWRQRAIRPPGYVLSPKSKWRLLWENKTIMERFQVLVIKEKSSKIQKRWKKAFRLMQSVSRFTMTLAEIASTTAQVFQDFMAIFDNDAQFFQKDNFKATSTGKNLDVSVLFTLSKPMIYRSTEESHEAAKALRVMHAFAEFPVYMQDKICEIAWYLELDKDKFLIRQGQEADSFYFLLSGKMAAVTVSIMSLTTFKVVGTYITGDILGEDGISGNGADRSYSMCTMEKCRLIAVNLSEFHDKCLEPPPDAINPSHIIFLSQLGFMRFFPMHKLVADTNGSILLFYYASGSIIAEDAILSDYVFVVFKGSVRVLAEINNRKCGTVKVTLPPIQTDYKGESAELDSFNNGSTPSTSAFTFRSKMSIIGSPSGSVTGVGPFTSFEDDNVMSEDGSRRGSLSQPDHKGVKMAENLTKTWGRRTIAETVRQKSLAMRQSARQSSLVHAASVEKFVPKRHTDKTAPDGKHEGKRSDWVHMKTMREGDVVGLETLNIGDTLDKKPARVAVVSRGAEMILVLKDFFLEHCSPLMRMDLRASSYIFPDEAQLKQEMARRNEWKRFQRKVISELVVARD